MNQEPPSLTATGLGLAVGTTDKRWLVRHLDAGFAPGTITAIVGPNGSGKSTLLRCLCGLSAATEGTVVLGKRPLTAWPLRERAKTIAYLPQATPLVYDMRVSEVVELGRAPYRGRFRGGGTPRRGPNEPDYVAQALSRVDASELGHRRVSTLSGGERQRVMIARMLATGAGLLVMDEPTAALDVGQVLALHALLRDLAAQDRGIVIAMHDLNAARELADEAICLDRRDDTGQHHHGAAAKVLGPTVLAEVFGVGVTEVDGSLRFVREPG